MAYIKLLPWNETRQAEITCYDLAGVVSYLAGLKGLPGCCFSRDGDGRCVKIVYGRDYETYLPGKPDSTEDAESTVKNLNDASGVTEAERRIMENAFIRGWDGPYADRENYDAGGQYIPKKKKTRLFGRERRRNA